jgi:MazG family protein
MSQAVDQLREIIARLRAPGGCPWDREQTAASLRTSLIEEAYEVIDAIERGHSTDLREELGDLLINVLMQAEIASEQKTFDLEAIGSTASEKLVRRHPHVFSDAAAATSEAVLTQWEEIKKAERLAKESGVSAETSLLDGVAPAFPALVRAQKIQKKAAKAGFDWECPEDVIDKIREEITEVEEELATPERAAVGERLADEVGDLLFAVVNLSRALSIDAESALRAATDKFIKRFRLMERNVPFGKSFADLTLDEMNSLWELAKKSERSN